jgi:hypothetical protein
MIMKFTGVAVGEGDGDAVTDPLGVGDTFDGVGVATVLVELLLQPPVAITLRRKTITTLAASARSAAGSAKDA